MPAFVESKGVCFRAGDLLDGSSQIRATGYGMPFAPAPHDTIRRCGDARRAKGRDKRDVRGRRGNVGLPGTDRPPRDDIATVRQGENVIPAGGNRDDVAKAGWNVGAPD